MSNVIEPLVQEWRHHLCVCAVFGAPGTGKTSLIRQVAARLGPAKKFVSGFVRGHYYEKHKAVVITHDDLPDTNLGEALRRDAVKLVSRSARGELPIEIVLLESPLFEQEAFLRRLQQAASLRLFMLHTAPEIQVERLFKDGKKTDYGSRTNPALQDLTANFAFGKLQNNYPPDLQRAEATLIASLNQRH